MANINYKQIYAIKRQNEERIKKVCPQVNSRSGIYILTREENGFRFAYIGQALNLIERLGSHLSGYQQHIDLSLKKHKLWSSDNPLGWKIECINFPQEQLNDKEQEYILKYANMGFQLKNKTSGSQGEGKVGIAENKSPKGYRDGLEQGYKNARKDVKPLFDKYLDYNIKTEKQNNRFAENALEKFKNFLEE